MSDLQDEERMIQLGIAPSRIDLMKTLSSSLPFEKAWEARARGTFSGVETQYLSLEDLIREKESADRDQDRADVDRLRRSLDRKDEG